MLLTRLLHTFLDSTDTKQRPLSGKGGALYKSHAYGNFQRLAKSRGHAEQKRSHPTQADGKLWPRQSSKLKIAMTSRLLLPGNERSATDLNVVPCPVGPTKRANVGLWYEKQGERALCASSPCWDSVPRLRMELGWGKCERRRISAPSDVICILREVRQRPPFATLSKPTI